MYEPHACRCMYVVCPHPHAAIVETTRYAPIESRLLKAIHGSRRKEKKKKRKGEKSPVHCPSIFRQEFLTSCLESVVVSQVLDRDGSTRQRINASLFNILGDTNAIEAGAGWCNNWIMHDLKCDTVDEIVRNNLEARVNYQNIPKKATCDENIPVPESHPWKQFETLPSNS